MFCEIHNFDEFVVATYASQARQRRGVDGGQRFAGKVAGDNVEVFASFRHPIFEPQCDSFGYAFSLALSGLRQAGRRRRNE